MRFRSNLVILIGSLLLTISAVSSADLGDKCNEDADCQLDNAKCTDSDDEPEDKVCSCDEGYHQVGDKECREDVALGDKCNEDADCSVDNAKCTDSDDNPEDKECTCDEGYHQIGDNECRKDVALGDKCNDVDDCVVETEDTAQCSVSDDNPEDTVCQCIEGYHPVGDNDCEEDVVLGSSCKGKEDCVFALDDPTVQCYNEQCSCLQGYYPSDKTTCVPAGGGFSCDEVDGAELDGDGKCRCTDLDSVIDSSETHCEKIAFEGFHAPCIDSNQCTARMGVGAICTTNKCRCFEGYHYLHGQCWKDKGVGDPCSTDNQCISFFETDALECAAGACRCVPESTYQLRADMCRLIAGKNEPCESDNDCDEGLKCDKVKKNDLNTLCLAPSKMSSTVPNYYRQWNTSMNEGGSDEEDYALNTCGNNMELTPGGNCVCKRGYFTNSTTSQCIPELGEPCLNVTTDCLDIEYVACRRSAKAEKEGDMGYCACQGGFVPSTDNRWCERTRTNAFNCANNTQCAYYGGKCDGSSCFCPEGYHYVSERILCWPTKGLGDECKEHYDCSVQTGSVECTEQKRCACASGFHEAGSGDCRRNAWSLGDPCTETSDCQFASPEDPVVCSSGRCSCEAGYFKSDDTTCSVGAMGPCKTNVDCAANGTECIGEVCTCKNETVRSRDYSRCLPVLDYGELCEEDDQCAHLSSLITCDYKDFITFEMICKCFDTFHWKNDDCYSDKNLGQRCNKESECIPDFSLCLNDFCECDYGYTAEGEKCVKGGAAQIASGMALSTLITMQVVLLLFYNSQKSHSQQ